MSSIISLPDNKLSPVESMSDLTHAVYQLFPDAYIDVDNDSDTIVIYTSLRYNTANGSVK
jgi:hypothetical protein